jgi:hypothetical protein
MRSLKRFLNVCLSIVIGFFVGTMVMITVDLLTSREVGGDNWDGALIVLGAMALVIWDRHLRFTCDCPTVRTL